MSDTGLILVDTFFSQIQNDKDFWWLLILQIQNIHCHFQCKVFKFVGFILWIFSPRSFALKIIAH